MRIVNAPRAVGELEMTAKQRVTADGRDAV
jgi:hypothetical protein